MIGCLLGLVLAGCGGQPATERRDDQRQAAPAASAAPEATDAPAASEAPTPSRSSAAPIRLTARVIAVYPHDPNAFTQGLLVADGILYESTGRYGASEVRAVEPESGRVLRRAALADDLFGEGLALAAGRLVQLTWREGVVLSWRPRDLAPLERLSYPGGEGWGLAFDGERLISSDGSDVVVFRDPETLAPLGELAVTLDGRPVGRLNELEWAEGALWANVWPSDTIVRIDPSTGRVTGVVDASGLLAPAERRGTDVLNGIAWWPERSTFLVTGKLWPKLFEVVFE